MWDRRAQYLDNHDGDTMNMLLDQGYGATLEIEVRLFGVYAPELSQIGGVDVKQFVRTWFMDRLGATNAKWPFISTTIRMKVADREQRTFTRYVGTITSQDPNDSLNLAVMTYISQKGYSGGTGS